MYDKLKPRSEAITAAISPASGGSMLVAKAIGRMIENGTTKKINRHTTYPTHGLRFAEVLSLTGTSVFACPACSVRS